MVVCVCVCLTSPFNEMVRIKKGDLLVQRREEKRKDKSVDSGLVLGSVWAVCVLDTGEARQGGGGGGVLQWQMEVGERH